MSGIKQETGNRTTEKAVKTFELIRAYTGKGYIQCIYIYGTNSIFEEKKHISLLLNIAIVVTRIHVLYMYLKTIKIIGKCHIKGN